jgi:hypothetical protein
VVLDLYWLTAKPPEQNTLESTTRTHYSSLNRETSREMSHVAISLKSDSSTAVMTERSAALDEALALPPGGGTS